MNKKLSERKPRSRTLPKSAIPQTPSRLADGWMYAIISAVVVLIYARTYFFAFSPMDDQWLIVSKAELLSDIRNLPGFFGENIYDLFYRPLFNVSFMIDQQIGGTASMFHFTNILLHLLCCCLFYRFLQLIKTEQRAALLLVLIFAVHPLNVQAVAWIPGRNDTLLALFVLAACNALLQFVRTKDAGWMLLHVIFSCAALLTKETAFALPAILAGLIFIYGKELGRKSKLIIAGTWLVILAVRIYLQVQLVPYKTNTADFFSTVFEFLKAMCMSTSKILVPAEQSIYPMTENASVLLYILPLAALCVIVWKYGVRNRALALFALCWLIVFSILPTWFGAYSNPPVYYENRMYLPLIGGLLFLLQLSIPLQEKTIRIAGIALVIVFAILSLRRAPVYADDFTYVLTATEEAPQVAFFHDMAGVALHDQGNHQLAVNYFNEAIRLDSTKATFYNHRGTTWYILKRYRNAIYDYNHALRLKPLQGETFFNRSIAYYSVGDYDAALLDLQRADSLGAAIDTKYIDALNRALLRRDSSAVPESREGRIP